jgi:hypothetical protein
MWIFCPALAGVLGNEGADRLVGSEPVKEKFEHDNNDVITALWETVWSDSDTMTNVYIQTC